MASWRKAVAGVCWVVLVLPVRVDLLATFEALTSGGLPAVSLEEGMEIDVALPGALHVHAGEAGWALRTYRGRLGGAPVVFLHAPGLLTVVGRAPDGSGITVLHRIAGAASRPGSVRARRDLAGRALRLHVYLHQDVASRITEADYLAWLQADLSSRLTGPGKPLDRIDLHVYRGVVPDPVNTFDYPAPRQSGVADSMFYMHHRLVSLGQQLRLQYPGHFAGGPGVINLHLLLVRHAPSRLAELEYDRGLGVAIASSRSYQAAGQAIGGLLGASGKDAAVLFDRWWCKTVMYRIMVDFRSNCYRFSDANYRNMEVYLSGPGLARPVPAPGSPGG